jgi:HSP20 family protein
MARDEHDSMEGLFKIWDFERAGSGRMKVHSELTWEPPIDVVETDEELIVVVEIAGMSGKDIDVVTDGKTLKISGLRKAGSPVGRKQFHRLEIQAGRFMREIPIPVRVDHSKVAASYRNGMLEVRIRKIQPSRHVRRVEID